MMMQMMAMTLVLPTSDLSHLEKGLIDADYSDKLTIARLKVELEKNKITVASVVQISQLIQRLKIVCFERDSFGNDASIVAFYTVFS